MRRHRAARLRVARRLRRRAPRRRRRSSSAPGRALRRPSCAARPYSPCRPARPQRAAHAADADSDAGADRDAGGGDDGLESVADDGGAGDDADAAAEDGYGLGDAYVEAGRVASRPGYPAEPAARSRPFGRVSLAPPFASLIPRFAWPAARCAHRRCQTDTLVASFTRVAAVTAVHSSRRRCAPRSSRCSPRSPWPAAPAAGIAPARFGDTPCLAGAGFAVHRLAHRAMHRCLRSCARSCGASAHFAPHRAGQSGSHRCGHFRRRFRRRAAHDPVQLPLHFPPLKRRGGSDMPLSPAPISRTSMLLDRPS